MAGPWRRPLPDAGVEPDPDTVLAGDPRELSPARATLYVLRVRTNRILIVASAAAYLFIAGVETFRVIYMRDEYGLSQAAATSTLSLIGIGALARRLVGGRVADRLLRDGMLDARIRIAAFAYALALIVLGGAAAGSLADRYGQVRVMEAGLWVYGVAILRPLA